MTPIGKDVKFLVWVIHTGKISIRCIVTNMINESEIIFYTISISAHEILIG